MWKFRSSLYALPLLLAFSAPAAWAGSLTLGFSISQFHDSANVGSEYSPTGNFLVDNSAGLTGFINVVDSLSGDWLVQNLPAGFLGSDIGLFAFFGTQMAVASAPSSSAAGSQSLYVNIASAPMTSSASVVADDIDGAQIYSVGIEEFNIGDTWSGSSDDTDEPAANNILQRPAPGTLTFTGGNDFTVTYQPGHPNIDAAVNQCAPAAVANSLDWMRTSQGLAVPAANPNTPGLRVPDGPPVANTNTLVATLENGANMNRTGVTSWTVGNGVWPLDGKLKYLGASGLGWLDVNFQNTDGGRPGGGNAFNDGNNYTAGGVTAVNRGAPSFDFILSELKRGEDVELDIAYRNAAGNVTGRHYVNVTGAGLLNGNPFITTVSDFRQGAPGNGGTDRVDLSWLKLDGGLLTITGGYGQGAYIDQVITESTPEPGTLALLGTGIGLLGWYRRRRAA